jgi:hypothetical protein
MYSHYNDNIHQEFKAGYQTRESCLRGAKLCTGTTVARYIDTHMPTMKLPPIFTAEDIQIDS